jgi:hypothetical protein
VRPQARPRAQAEARVTTTSPRFIAKCHFSERDPRHELEDLKNFLGLMHAAVVTNFSTAEILLGVGEKTTDLE